MSPSATEQIAQIAIAPAFRETGGSHNSQGIEFQKHWAVFRMFELTENGDKDFLFLFEALQDVAVLDGKDAPSAICIYQVKKKSRAEWNWGLLTKIHEPNAKKRKDLKEVKGSLVGKLYAVVRALSTLRSSGAFVSNFGCNIPLSPEGTFATTFSEPLDRLATGHLTLLKEALTHYHEEGESPPDLSKIRIERVNISPENPGTVLVGIVHDFLQKRSPAHAGQARALVDALLIKIASLSLRSATCKDFDELCQKCGFSKQDFDQALGALQEIPDDNEGLKSLVGALEQEGLPAFESYHIKVAGARIFRRRLLGGSTPDESSLVIACTSWLTANPPPRSNLLPFLERGILALNASAPSLSRHEIAAQILISILDYART